MTTYQDPGHRPAGVHSVHGPSKRAAKRVRAGVSFDEPLLEQLDARARDLKELGVDRSEIINAVLSAFFANDSGSEAVRTAVSNRRGRQEG